MYWKPGECTHWSSQYGILHIPKNAYSPWSTNGTLLTTDFSLSFHHTLFSFSLRNSIFLSAGFFIVFIFAQNTIHGTTSILPQLKWCSCMLKECTIWQAYASTCSTYSSIRLILQAMVWIHFRAIDLWSCRNGMHPLSRSTNVVHTIDRLARVLIYLNIGLRRASDLRKAYVGVSYILSAVQEHHFNWGRICQMVYFNKKTCREKYAVSERKWKQSVMKT